ncbi:MAG: energy-coupling factor transporter ATPase [Clostridia bacterium]|nr:energy-coupling factor transporter ATPase [Clostridia bacterium]
MSIEIRNLTHTYSEGTAMRTVALEDVCMTIEDGEFLGIIGHTGSGKSTLVQHLNGLLKPTSGQVFIDGEDLNGEHVNRRALRQRIGLVFQYPEYQLFEETVAKDIAFGPKNQGLSKEDIDERVRYAMDCVHLDYQKYSERSPFELSGGQMRRVAIAGVIAMRPSVLILDEPTAGLDPRGRDRILSMLEQLHAEQHTTIVMVSHSMDDMARLATRLIVMAEGKILATGTPREIFSQEKMMMSAGLGVPQVASLCSTLRAKGFDLPPDLYRPEELKEHILQLWKNKNKMNLSGKEGSPC